MTTIRQLLQDKGHQVYSVAPNDTVYVEPPKPLDRSMPRVGDDPVPRCARPAPPTTPSNPAPRRPQQQQQQQHHQRSPRTPELHRSPATRFTNLDGAAVDLTIVRPAAAPLARARGKWQREGQRGAAVEGFDERIVGWLSWPGEVKRDAALT